jgi:plastocyanin
METTPKPPEPSKPKSMTWKLIAIVVVILIVVGVAAYILTQQTTTNANVIIQDDTACGLNDASCLFNPASYNATVNGPAVVWRNDGGVTHTVGTNATLNANGLDTFTSNTLASHGGTFSHTFTVKGTYHYYCTIHAWMKGIINVN